MTIGQELIKASASLKSISKNPQLEAEILLSHIIKKPREYLFAHPEAKLTKRQVSGFRFQVLDRLRGVPIAYITGEKEFYGLKFLVDKNVLVPRPETELMVDVALTHITHNMEHITKKVSKINIIDVGTGSGCVIISLAKQLEDSKYNNLQFIATDISNKALTAAKKNAKLQNVYKKIKFKKGDLLVPVNCYMLHVTCYVAIITANLPYLTPTQIKKSPTLKYDPKLALSAGQDGLKYYRALFSQIHKLPITNYYILCEIDPSQKNSIRRLAKDFLPPHSFEIKKDLRGHNRLAIITNKQQSTINKQ